jgi:anti-sigma regulatory factor (Ser/Thr protein kinase)
MDVRTVLPCDASSVAAARRFLRAELGPAARTEAGHTAALLLTELVTNAVVHGRTAVEIHLASHDGILRAEVSDGNPRMPSARRPNALAGTGRGLQLVQSLASRWGVRSAGAGKTVWFEVGMGSPTTPHRTTAELGDTARSR